jgi:hypothetical protein
VAEPVELVAGAVELVVGGGATEVVVVVPVGGDVSGAVGGAAVAVRSFNCAVPGRETVDELPLDRDPPHPAAANSRAALKRSANRLTFAG